MGGVVLVQHETGILMLRIQIFTLLASQENGTGTELITREVLNFRSNLNIIIFSRVLIGGVFFIVAHP